MNIIYKSKKYHLTIKLIFIGILIILALTCDNLFRKVTF